MFARAVLLSSKTSGASVVLLPPPQLNVVQARSPVLAGRRVEGAGDASGESGSAAGVDFGFGSGQERRGSGDLPLSRDKILIDGLSEGVQDDSKNSME